VGLTWQHGAFYNRKVEQPTVPGLPVRPPARKPHFRILRHKDDLVERVVQKIEKQVLDPCGRGRRSCSWLSSS
jgi:hypothetical protein